MQTTGVSGMSISSGILRVNVIEARKLSNKDWFGKMDVFIKLALRNNVHKTKTMYKGGTAPKFNDTFSYPIASNLLDQSMIVTAWDEDMISNEFIGQLMIPISGLLQRDTDEWYTFFTKKNEFAGEIRIQTHFVPDQLSFQQQQQQQQQPSYPPQQFPQQQQQQQFQPPPPQYQPQYQQPPPQYQQQPIPQYQPQYQQQQPPQYQQQQYQQQQYQQQQYQQQPPYGIASAPPPAAALQSNSLVGVDPRKAFQLFDRNHDGTITVNEYICVMGALGQAISPQDAAVVFTIIDIDHDGKITETEFAEHWNLNYARR